MIPASGSIAGRDVEMPIVGLVMKLAGPAGRLDAEVDFNAEVANESIGELGCEAAQQLTRKRRNILPREDILGSIPGYSRAGRQPKTTRRVKMDRDKWSRSLDRKDRSDRPAGSAQAGPKGNWVPSPRPG